MNRGELKTALLEYMHRDDLSINLQDNIVDFATKRIGTNLRSLENEKTVTFSPTAHLSDLPADYESMRSIRYAARNTTPPLAVAPLDVVHRYPLSGSRPGVYAISAKQIDIRPFQAVDFELTYFHTPQALGDDADTNAVLTAYPYLYLYACLYEAHRWAQDPEQMSIALNNYVNELAAINKQSEIARHGNMPAMRGA